MSNNIKYSTNIICSGFIGANNNSKLIMTSAKELSKRYNTPEESLLKEAKEKGDPQLIQKLKSFIADCRNPKEGFHLRKTCHLEGKFGHVGIRNTNRCIPGSKTYYWSIEIFRIMVYFRRIGLGTAIWDTIVESCPHDIIYVESVMTQEMEEFCKSKGCTNMSGNCYYKLLKK